MSVMKYYLIVFLSLLSILPLTVHAHSDGSFWKNSTIAHLEAGLFFDYVGLYKPSNTIIHNSAIFPMTTEACHLLPLSDAADIPLCNVTTHRHKRSRSRLISLGVGIISMGLSVANSIQLLNLQEQVEMIENTLSEFSQTIQIHEAKLAKIQPNQIKIAEQLQVTQHAINDIIPVLDSHSQALNTLKTGIERLHTNFQRSSIYLAITQIFRNQLTLNFLSPDDLQKVVYHVIEQGNLTFNAHHGSIPIVEIITKLLVRQQIDFIPSSQYKNQNPQEIGRLVITSFFAVPQQEQTSFHVYKLLTMPYLYKNRTIQLSHIPRYWAINPTDNTTMEWHDPEESGCNLQLMTSCRDTPPLRTISKDSCLGQIIGSLPLSSCHAKYVSHSGVFVRQLTDNIWVTSSSESLHCLKIPKIEYRTSNHQTLNKSQQIILPPVALVNVTPGYTILCPGFTLVGRPRTSNVSSLIILNDMGLFSINMSIVDVSRHLTDNTTWFKTNWTEQRMQEIINDLRQPITVPTTRQFPPIHKWSLNMLVTKLTFFGLAASLIYLAFRRCRTTNHQTLRII